MTTDVHALLGGYVADALSPRELAEFEQHLTTCQSCRDEVRELRETAADLSHMVAAPPPPALRERVLATAATIRPEPPALIVRRPRVSARLRVVLTLAALAVLAWVIRDPAGAAVIARQLATWGAAMLDGLVAFFHALS